MKLRKQIIAFASTLFLFGSMAWAGSPSEVTEELGSTGQGCEVRVACNKINKHALKSSVAVRQLLANSGVNVAATKL